MSTWIEVTKGRSIQESFEAFHKKNPAIYEHIIRQCDRAVRGGKKRFSIKQIIGWIRWEVFITTNEPTLFELGGETKKFKINDAYTSRYSRLVIQHHPEWTDHIELRDLRS